MSDSISRPEFEELKSDVKRILMYIENDDKTGAQGLPAETRALRKDVDNLIIEGKIKKAVAAAWGIFGGLLVTVITWIYKLIDILT